MRSIKKHKKGGSMQLSHLIIVGVIILGVVAFFKFRSFFHP